MFDEQMIHGDRLERGPRDRPTTVRAKVRLPWYRSLPLSCIERIEVEIDGRSIPAETIVLRTNGHVHRVAELPQLHEVEWFVLDALDLDLDTAEELASGKHRMALGMQMRIPYGDKDFGDFEFVQTARCIKDLELVGRDA
jgi:hypothetical protein